jgi:light-regulated signal transduction histidine kinase (bacteriophytochrome)
VQRNRDNKIDLLQPTCQQNANLRHAISQQDSDKPLIIKIKTLRLGDRNCLTIQDNSLNLKRRKMDTSDSFPRNEAKEAENGLLFQIIKTQIELIGGKAEMETKPGFGTTFKLYLML